MAIQSQIGAFDKSAAPTRAQTLPPKPSDDELEHLIAPNWLYDEFDTNNVAKIDELRQRIRDAIYANDPIREWSFIIGDLISCGNKKLAKEIAIYNFGGSATDCPNIGTKHCQVPKKQCYAYRSENNFPNALDARRRELIVWDHLDAVTFAKAFRRWHGRKRNEITTLRLSESGDFRHRHDLFKVDEVARQLDDIVDTYVYSASDWLPWEEISHVTVNRSNDHRKFGVRRFEVVDSVEEIPDNGIRCPHDLSDGDIKCGECRLCIDKDAGDVYVKNFYTDDENEE
jgi:hypothetical protein